MTSSAAIACGSSGTQQGLFGDELGVDGDQGEGRQVEELLERGEDGEFGSGEQFARRGRRRW
jgi:hypothetical protein